MGNHLSVLVNVMPNCMHVCFKDTFTNPYPHSQGPRSGSTPKRPDEDPRGQLREDLPREGILLADGTGRNPICGARIKQSARI